MTAAFEGFAAQLLWALACHWAISKSYCTQVTQLLFRYMTASFTPQLEEHLVTLYLANALVELQAGGGGRLDALQTNSWTSGASLLASALAEYRQLGDAQEGDRGQCMTRLLHVLLQQVCEGRGGVPWSSAGVWFMDVPYGCASWVCFMDMHATLYINLYMNDTHGLITLVLATLYLHIYRGVG